MTSANGSLSAGGSPYTVCTVASLFSISETTLALSRYFARFKILFVLVVFVLKIKKLVCVVKFVKVTTLPEDFPEAHSTANNLRLEYVVAVEGVVRSRPSEAVNENMKTGFIEVCY